MSTTLDDINRLSPEEKRALLEQMLREKTAQASAAPLSSGQQRLWFLDRLEPNTPLYNISTALRLKGDLNVNALQGGLNEIVRRHEVLRTVFPSIDGSPVQQINQPSSIPFQKLDLTTVPAASREAEAQRHIRQAASKPFDLSRDLMIRGTLLKLSDRERVLVLVAHHIAADEWSLRVLFKELALLYEARMTGTQLTLPDPAIQYADYSIWQAEEQQSESMQKQLDYWREQLQGATTNLELPSDLPRKECANRGAIECANRGAIARFTMPAADLEAVKELARRENATLFMTLLAGYDALLHRYTRQEDILVGSPIAGRTRSETEDLIGFFVNTIVLRARFDEKMTFRDLLAQVRETTLGAYAHQDLPFEKLVEEVHPDRSASGSPLVQVMFSLNTDFVEEQLLPGLRVEPMEVENGTAKFDLTLVAHETREGLQLVAEYDVDLFTSTMMNRLLEHYANLLRAAAAAPETPLIKINFLGEAEKKRLLVEWNNTRKQYPRDVSISHLVEQWAMSRPQSPGVSYGESTLTYAELNARANQLAHQLQTFGLKRGDVVGLLTERSNEMIVAMLGILKAGGGYLPLDPSYPQERLAFMLNDSGARFLVTQPALTKLIEKHGAQIVPIDSAFKSLTGQREGNLPDSPAATDLANLIYTSGSTGLPKGVCIPHRGIVRLVRDTDYMEVAPTDVVTQTSSISFDAATWEIWTALINGAHLVGISKDELVDPSAFKSKLKKAQATIVFTTTAVFNQIASEIPGVFENLKYVFFGGEAADPKSVASVLKNRPPHRLMHAYGPTETTVYATVHWVRDVAPDAKTIPIGKPIANSTAYILDSARNLAPIGVPGELWLGGDGMALGYLNRPELTAERFIPDPFSSEPGARLYRSGDLARLREDGAIEFLGRVDTQVKIRGFRIELGEIEAALLQHPANRKAAVLAREDSPGDKRLVGYVEFAADQKVEVATLKTFLKQTLPEFMVPAAFVILEKMPLLPNGKVDRKQLPAPEWKGIERRFEAPATDLEQKIAKIFERVLNVQPVGATDNFFDLGGHSLLAVKLFSQFEKAFARKLPLATLFKAPTIRQLAEILSGEDKPQSWSTIVDIQPKGTKRPIFWIHSLGGDGGGGFFYYRRLAELLGEDQPSFGIRSPQEPFDRIESMAEYYIKSLREVQPTGPYQLGGFCFGGVVAYEMARQLIEAGEKVSLLAILESGPPNLGKIHRDAAYSLENVYENLRDFVAHPAGEKVEMVRRKARKLRDKLIARRQENTEEKPAALNDFIDMSKYPKDYVKYAETHWKALESYRPIPFKGTISLFRARKQPLRSADPSLGWNTLAPGRVRITVVPGNHESMVQDPNVHVLAAKIQEAIRATSE
jgi:amino acid adenylation domain-containing protein